ncbi:Ser-Thr-rich glycosyl-phosphatidyl-inositol-anchored membrane family-domain-containing protein [Macrophomina phaseolina]|uniref:Ser-Thr-rich glycosyl-phosphatidyl-inositol-anchored membrane family-domain-containing protein n=1 Tax=Macrophomina phaseolina TaxID=35725 RepID=A0ABQ8G626_9PEZI|nr:Ser-Thr-rich glycosyl-phosphatidyl-inositol-anchored membrane family-domain-containing protein [Macrophomina phaseolina]
MHFSSNSLLTLLATSLATVTRADNGPTANAVRVPGLHDIVPVGLPYTIKWDADAPYVGGTVSLTLLKGPSTNAVPYLSIVNGTTNNGSYTWNVPTTLPDSNGDTGYGIMMVIDANSAYQYTTQFGISNKSS